jgi:hypothetical protein
MYLQKIISRTNFWNWRSTTNGSGSISQRHGSADPDPDPHQNVMDPVGMPLMGMPPMATMQPHQLQQPPRPLGLVMPPRPALPPAHFARPPKRVSQHFFEKTPFFYITILYRLFPGFCFYISSSIIETSVLNIGGSEFTLVQHNLGPC